MVTFMVTLKYRVVSCAHSLAFKGVLDCLLEGGQISFHAFGSGVYFIPRIRKWSVYYSQILS
jgi:hypothetical protein